MNLSRETISFLLWTNVMGCLTFSASTEWNNNLELQEFECFPQLKSLSFQIANFCQQNKNLISNVTILEATIMLLLPLPPQKNVGKNETVKLL